MDITGKIRIKTFLGHIYCI